MRFAIFILLLCLSYYSSAQEEETLPTPHNYDFVYQNYIKSVRFYQFDSETDYPMLELGSSNHFILEFDDMEAYTKDYFYKIIHCDAQWNPSEDIDAIDYIDGYQENRIYSGENSFSTRVPYVHYKVQLPNEDVKWTISGNYLLKVYQNDDENDLIITKRFMIVDTKMKAFPQMRRSAVPPYASSHQEFSCEIQHTGISIGNPAEQIDLVVLQNGRWDNAITTLEPTYIRHEAIGYDMTGKIIFPGYKEFRGLDLRSFRFRTQHVETLQEYVEGFEITLFQDKTRTYNPHVFTHDLNGKFFIESKDYPDQPLQEEYGDINFSLHSDIEKQGDVYVIGSFTDFRVKPEFKLKYNNKTFQYELTTTLKNGFYDYYYAIVEEGQTVPNIQEMEGSSFETENDYLFLVYFRAFGGLYDQLVAIQKLNTNPR
jgi:hypothetical protein